MRFLILFLLISCMAPAQSKFYIRADSTYIIKVGGNNELILENGTKNVPGVLVNKGNGRTEFARATINGDTLFLGRDTVLGIGASIEPTSVFWKKDTVDLFRLDPTVNTTSNGWSSGATYSGNATESIVASGIRIEHAYTGVLSNNNIVYNGGWESTINDGVIVEEAQVVGWGSSNAFIGIVQRGANAIFATNNFWYINLNTGSVGISNFNVNNASYGTLTNTIARDDIIRMTSRRNFDELTFTVENLTKGTPVETFSWQKSVAASTNIFTTMNPGMYFSNDTVIVRSFKYYGHNYRPDIMWLGSSIEQNEKSSLSYQTSFIGRLDSISSLKFELGAKSASTVEDWVSSLPEIVQMKPRIVVVPGPYNNQQTSAQPPTTWGPVFRGLVDTLLSRGIDVVVQKSTPANNTSPTTINTWFDSTYSNHPRVQIIDLFSTTSLYKGDTTNFYNARYYSDGVHPTDVGGFEMAKYAKTQIERIATRDNMAGAPDANMISRRDKQIYVYDSAGINQGTWNPYRLVGLTFNSSNSTATATGSGGSQGLEDVLTVDPVLTTSHNITHAGIEISGTSDMELQSNTLLSILGAGSEMRFRDSIEVDWSGSTSKVFNLGANLAKNQLANDSMLTYNPTTGRASYKAIPTANVTKVGTPVNNQVGIWTGDGTIKGETTLTYNGSNELLVGTSTDQGTYTLQVGGPLHVNTTGTVTSFQMNNISNLYAEVRFSQAGTTRYVFGHGGSSAIAPYAGNAYHQLATGSNNFVWINSSNNTIATLSNAGKLGIGATPTAYLHLAAGTTAATTAPLKFIAGTNMTAAEAGAMEWDGANLFITQNTGPTRKTIAYTTDLATSGTYTPTLTNTTNITASVANANTTYERTGNRVCVSGSITVTPTAELSDCVLGFSLPVASSITDYTQGGGSGALEPNGVAHANGVSIKMDATNDRATFTFYAPSDGSAIILTFNFCYSVL